MAPTDVWPARRLNGHERRGYVAFMGEDRVRRGQIRKALEAHEGDDEFSISSVKPDPRRAPVKLRPTLREMIVPAGTPPPTPQKNLLVRLARRIFR